MLYEVPLEWWESLHYNALNEIDLNKVSDSYIR
jgi:hypothetical protein